MPRRRRKRRQRLDRQEERQEAQAAGVPVAEEPAPEPERPAAGGISFSGAAGGLLGAAVFYIAAIDIVIGQSDEARLLAIPSVLIGLFFLPAIWVSVVRDHPRRQRSLKITTVGAMGIAMLSLPFFGFLLAVLLAPSTALLAIGAGFIFQRSGSSA